MTEQRRQYFTGMQGAILNLIPNAVCGECGAPSTMAERDLQEVASLSQWKEYTPASIWRFGCYKHPPKKGKLLPLESGQ